MNLKKSSNVLRHLFLPISFCVLVTFFFFLGQADGYLPEDIQFPSDMKTNFSSDQEPVEEDGNEDRQEEDPEENEDEEGEDLEDSDSDAQEEQASETLENSSLEREPLPTPVEEEVGLESAEEEGIEQQDALDQPLDTFLSEENSETLGLDFKNFAPPSLPTSESVPASTGSGCTNCDASADQASYDFGMASFGLEAGMSVPNYGYTTSLGRGSHATYSAQQGILGVRLTWEKFISDQWTAGVTGSFRYAIGDVKGVHNAVNAFSEMFKAQNMQRYELAAKFSRPSGAFQPYVKAGAVMSNFLVTYQDTTFKSGAKKQSAVGLMMGGGVDTEVSQGILMGGMVEYDYYDTLKGTLSNSTGMGGMYKVSPSMVNVMLTLTCKMDQYF